ncbi:MAG: tetratricopeptide repeat protein [Crocosphaera sp.]|nr:tetratricopeptide repeat protein [Crocosphaera sp.]
MCQAKRTQYRNLSKLFLRSITSRKRIRGKKADNLEAAIQAYKQSLKVYTRDAFPYEWARTQNNLGAAYSDRIREQKEIERDRNLQINIFAIGSSLAVAGIIVSSYGLVTPENPLFTPKFSHHFRSVSPFYKSVFLSIVCAIITYFTIKLIQKIIQMFTKK